MKKLILLLAFLIPIFTFSQITINIPDDYPTIQAGIDAAIAGDTVLVDTGSYFENINFKGKAITVAGKYIIDGDTSHISNTIIDGSQPDNPNLGSVVTFDSGEDTTSILCGFTITGGTGTKVPGFNARSGGGIQCYPAGAKIIHNKIINNSVITDGGGYGAGILADHTYENWIVIADNVIRDNSINSVAEAFGGGVSVFGQARIENNEITNNMASSMVGIAGGGISCKGTFYDPSPKELLLSNNIIDNNTGNSQSANTEGAYFGGLYIEGYFGSVRNNTITNNSVSAYDGQLCYAPGLMSIRNPDDLIVENNIIQDNYFTNGECWGGGICVWMGGGVYQNNVIQNNQASTGGGMYIHSFGTGQILQIINNTISGNDAADYGGGLYIQGSEVVILNTIVWGNTVGSATSSIYEAESNLEVRYSNVEAGEEWPGEGNINISPLFKEDGYHLDFASTLLNEGKESVEINGLYYDCPESDIDSQERPFENTYPEIGADEAEWYFVFVDESRFTTNSMLGIHPNPFSTSTTIEYELTNTETVRITFCNQFGKQVDVIEQDQQKGLNKVVWTPKNLVDGIYYFRLQAGEQIATGKIILLK